MTFALAALALLGQTQAPIQLFNGSNLDGWTMDVPALDANPGGPKPFVVRGKNLVTLGTPGGHLVSNQAFQNYRLIAEYRFTGKPGNCGILVHASSPRALYSMFPKSIEVQLQSGDAGDFWCIGENIEVPDMVSRRGPEESWGVDGDKARRIKNLTDGSEHRLGQWNTIVVDCRGNAIKVWVNGDLVNSGTNATASSGKIAIQSEGTEVEFRRFEVQPYPVR